MHQHRATAGTYLVDNSILQIQGRPGVGFRYSKHDVDRVGDERSPAMWGDIVHGMDEGDGWLKVGDHFLPMSYQGMPVLKRLPELDAEETPLCAGWMSSSSSSSSSLCREAGLKAMGLPTLARMPLPEADQALMRSVRSGRRSKEAPLSPLLEQRSREEVDEVDEEREEEAAAKRSEAEPRAWFLQPSVGTWLRQTPAAPVEVTRLAEDIEEKEDTEVKWWNAPSVGTWLLSRSDVGDEAELTAEGEGIVASEHKPAPMVSGVFVGAEPELLERETAAPERLHVNREGPPVLLSMDDANIAKVQAPELQLFTDMLAAKRGTSAFSAHEDFAGKDSEFSPSTCAPDSPNYIPTPMSVVSWGMSQSLNQ